MILQTYWNAFKQKRIYQKRFKQFGANHKALHWHSLETQYLRYTTFFAMDNLNGKSILDIGCGIGDFLNFLKLMRTPVRYTGYDIVPEFIDYCRMQFPNAHFELRNVFAQPTRNRFDYVFCSGLFAFGNQKFFQNGIRTAFNLCRQGLAFNIHETQDVGFFKISKQEAMTFCKTLQPTRVELKEDYLPFDFTIQMYK